MAPIDHENDWIEHKLLVMANLESINRQQTEILKQLNEIKTDFAVLRVKAGFLGLVAGAVGTAVSFTVKGFLKGN